MLALLIWYIITGHIIFSITCGKEGCINWSRPLYCIIMLTDFAQYPFIVVGVCYGIAMGIKWYFVPLDNNDTNNNDSSENSSESSSKNSSESSNNNETNSTKREYKKTGYRKLNKVNKKLLHAMIILLTIIILLIVLLGVFFSPDYAVNVHIILMIVSLLIINHRGFYNSRYEMNPVDNIIDGVFLLPLVIIGPIFGAIGISNACSQGSFIVVHPLYLISMICTLISALCFLILLLIGLVCICTDKSCNICDDGDDDVTTNRDDIYIDTNKVKKIEFVSIRTIPISTN
jgi:hypothetical protein